MHAEVEKRGDRHPTGPLSGITREGRLWFWKEKRQRKKRRPGPENGSGNVKSPSPQKNALLQEEKR